MWKLLLILALTAYVVNAKDGCKGDKNARPGCDEECLKRCRGDEPKECKCPKDSCECNPGYVYNSKMKKCTKPDQCEKKDEKKQKDSLRSKPDSKHLRTARKGKQAGKTTL